MTMSMPQVVETAVRGCPLCASTRKRTLLELTADVIFKSNWSYRKEAAAAVAAACPQPFPIAQCEDCGFVYAGLLPSPAFIQELYDSVIDSDAARSANLSRTSLARKMGDLAALFGVVPSSTEPVRLLDYGCGFGPALEVLRCLPGVRALGYETSAVRLRDLSRRGLSATGDTGAVAKSGPFEVVLLDNVLEHLPHPREVLAFVHTTCAPGAVLYVSVPDIGPDTVAAQSRAARAGQPVLMDVNPWEHLNYFQSRHLDALLADFGFQPIAQASLPAPVDIGLRASPTFGGRLRNGLGSTLRLWRYIRQGEGLHTVNRRFYRLEGP